MHLVALVDGCCQDRRQAESIFLQLPQFDQLLFVHPIHPDELYPFYFLVAQHNKYFPTGWHLWHHLYPTDSQLTDLLSQIFLWGILEQHREEH